MSISTSFCEIDLDNIFNIKSFTNKQEKLDFFNETSLKKGYSKHLHADKEIKTIFLEFEENQDFDYKKLEIALGTLLWENPEDIKIIRLKGIINIKND